ncbi:MAG: PHP domain-containing protein [Chloroflexi bacterium]|nr:MAG: PHP domain-containing protein [Chloroflexota bacterium]
MFPVDLHTHTTASDGTHTPTQLVARAAKNGVRVLGIADHDTVAGVSEAIEAGRQAGIEVVPGVEFSLKHEPDKGFIGIHLLGYFIDITMPRLQEVIQQVQQARVEQKIRQIEKLQTLGFNITVDEVFSRVQGVPGRPHIAAVLMEKYPGRFASLQQVFDEFLGTGRPAHVKRDFALTMRQAVVLIREAGGVPVLAHPGIYEPVANPVSVVRNACREGIMGLEVFYPYPASARTNWVGRMEALARDLGLAVTGGSDFHGRPGENLEPGEAGLTGELFDRFRQVARQG